MEAGILAAEAIIAKQQSGPAAIPLIHVKAGRKMILACCFDKK
jgi:hypothetical protein